MHDLPCAADGGAGREHGGGVVIQIPHLGAHIGDQLGSLKAEAIQNDLSLVADLTQTGGLVLTLTQRILQRGIGHGRNDGVGIGVLMAGDINGIHSKSFLCIKDESG